MSNGGNGPSEAVGLELHRFFVELLGQGNLLRYLENREAYIDERRQQELVGDEARRLLLEGTLAEIEANLALASVSGTRPTMMYIVWPPWGT